MDYYTLTTRLIAIKREIHELRQTKFDTIPSRLKTLQHINLLLEERNDLLLIKQEMIIKEREVIIMAQRSDTCIERVFDSLNNKIASKRIKLYTPPNKTISSAN